MVHSVLHSALLKSAKKTRTEHFYAVKFQILILKGISCFWRQPQVTV